MRIRMTEEMQPKQEAKQEAKQRPLEEAIPDKAFSGSGLPGICGAGSEVSIPVGCKLTINRGSF